MVVETVIIVGGIKIWNKNESPPRWLTFDRGLAWSEEVGLPREQSITCPPSALAEDGNVTGRRKSQKPWTHFSLCESPPKSLMNLEMKRNRTGKLLYHLGLGKSLLHYGYAINELVLSIKFSLRRRLPSDVFMIFGWCQDIKRKSMLKVDLSLKGLSVLV